MPPRDEPSPGETLPYAGRWIARLGERIVGQGGTPVREYYGLGSDPWELTNLLHDGNSGNDPDVGGLTAQLARDRRCVGYGPENGEPPPCP